MPAFHYIAINTKGEKQKGVIEAEICETRAPIIA